MTLPPPVFLDPSIPRKRQIISDRYKELEGAVVLPGVVEISESGTCNRTCAFCPRSDPAYPDVKEFIEPGLLEKLARQLGECGFGGLIIFSGFAEPLLDKKIFEKLALTKSILPASRIELITNGDTLTPSVIGRLMESGLTTLLISVYDGPEDAERFAKMCKEDAGLEDDQYVIRNRFLPPEQDYGITMSNRGGMMDTTEHVRPALTEQLSETCYYPSYMFFMDYQGDVLLCSHDWGKKFVCGNILQSDIFSIWTNERMAEARQKLSSCNRNLSSCEKCNVVGELIGKESFSAWLNIEKK